MSFLQALTYVDDFRSERADRERAQSRIQDLEEEVMRLKLQIRSQARTASELQTKWPLPILYSDHSIYPSCYTAGPTDPFKS